MDGTSIVEGVISGVIATLISGFIVFIIKILISRKAPDEEKKDAKISDFKTNPFLISLFATSFFVVLTFFSMVYAWTTFNSGYTILASFLLGLVTVWIYNNQCPRCNKIFNKKLVKKEKIHEEKRPYRYREETIYLYSDGSEKERKYRGKEKTRMETWRTEKEYYECTSCGYNWDKIFERNLDKDNRPKPNIVRTKTKPPDPFRD
jgi:hypothetical protein